MEPNELINKAVETLFGVFDSDHAERFEQLCLEAKILLRCPKCKWNCGLGTEVCPECGHVLSEEYEED